MIKIKYGRLIDSYLVTYSFGPFTLFGKAIHVSKMSTGKLTCWKQDQRASEVKIGTHRVSCRLVI